MSQAAPDEAGPEDLDPDALLDALADADRRARSAERDKLRIAHQWAVLHPATADTGIATFGGDLLLLPALLAGESLGGEGCPKVAAYAPEPLAITLGVAPVTAMQLIADALDLHHRLPQTWALVESLTVPAWKARQVAQLTHALPRNGAAWVDERIAPRLQRCGARLLDNLLAEAIARYDPDRQAEREARAKKQTWDIALHTPTASEYAGTSELHITGDTLWLTDLYRQVCRAAATATPAGHDDPLGVRKVQALATLLHSSGPGDVQTATARSRQPATVLYLHLDLADLDDHPLHTSGSLHTVGTGRVGRVERLGPATVEKIRAWVGNSRVRIQPVIRMDTDDAVDGHDPPQRIRDQVVLRDPTCQFPNCQVDARRCDLDHTTPYDPGPDNAGGAPPGQTRPSNLVPLCRRHHNAKTTGLWRYTRTPDGTCVWTGPHVRGVVS